MAKNKKKNLKEFTGAPYIFHLKDGTALRLGDFTVYAELWADEEFGSVQTFYNKILGTGGKDVKPDVIAILKTVLFLLDEEFKDRFENHEELAKQLTFNGLKEASSCLMRSIHDSLPEELKKILLANALQTKKPN